MDADPKLVSHLPAIQRDQDQPQDPNDEATTKGTPPPPPTNDACQDASSKSLTTCQTRRQMQFPSADDSGTQPGATELGDSAISEERASPRSPGNSPGTYLFLSFRKLLSFVFSLST